MVVGFTQLSDSESAGSSTGKPPACQTPRLTSSTRCRKCWWQGWASLQVLMIPTTGLPMKSSSHSPSAGARAMAEGAQILHAEPAVASQVVGSFVPIGQVLHPSEWSATAAGAAGWASVVRLRFPRRRGDGRSRHALPWHCEPGCRPAPRSPRL